ncbi:MAG: hypothetical protein ABI923_07285 [bacterium]
MKNRIVLLRLLACSMVSLILIFAVYLWFGGNPYNRIGYGLTMSLIPAFVALILAWRSRNPWSWQRTASVYALLFAATVVIQGYARML